MQEDQDLCCDQLLADLYSFLPSHLVPFSTYPVGQGVQVYAGRLGLALCLAAGMSVQFLPTEQGLTLQPS